MAPSPSSGPPASDAPGPAPDGAGGTGVAAPPPGRDTPLRRKANAGVMLTRAEATRRAGVALDETRISLGTDTLGAEIRTVLAMAQAARSAPVDTRTQTFRSMFGRLHDMTALALFVERPDIARACRSAVDALERLDMSQERAAEAFRVHLSALALAERCLAAGDGAVATPVLDSLAAMVEQLSREIPATGPFWREPPRDGATAAAADAGETAP